MPYNPFFRRSSNKRTVRALMAVTMVTTAWCMTACAQDAKKVANFVRSSLESRSKEIIAVTVAMPAARFGSRPSPQDLTFAELTLHVADTNLLYCSKIGNVPQPSLAAIGADAPKQKLAERMKTSFDFCATALSRVADLDRSETLMIGEAKTSRAMAILTLTGTWADHSSIQAKYVDADQRVPAVAGN